MRVNERKASSRKDLPRLFALSAALFSGAMFAVYALCPACRETLIVEDGVTEWVTAALFVASLCVGTRRLARIGFRPRWYWVIPVFGLLGALDELSFGQRLFELDMPVVRHVRIDALHDLVELGYRGGVKVLTAGGLAAFLVVLGIVAGVLLFRARHRVAGLFERHRPLTYAAFAPVFIAPAMLIDLEVFPRYAVVVFVEELCEAMAALAWVFAALAIEKPAAASGAGQVGAPFG